MWPRIARALRHPIMVMVVLVVLCRVVKNGYPFNSFPMYAEPGPNPSNYLIVADGAGKPLDVQWHTGMSSSGVKKIFTERFNRACDQRGLDPEEATPEIKQEAFSTTVRQIREAARKRKRPLPDKVRVTDVLIYQDGTSFREVPQVLGEG